ncbi:L-type lectin-domain containing protein [Fluviicola sp.]|uniref:L-type lectin-domain containing protein n=1 Tax=Fluviicola sp. TaxID=1917219 RepID=UPI003D26C1F6
MKYLALFLAFTGIMYTHSYAQYQVSGNALALTPDTFLLTPDAAWQNGAVWYKLKHNFNTPFAITGSMFFGDFDDGADGIVFVVQNKCLVAGTAGGGIGYMNFPGYSLGVEFDTYQNVGPPSNDPVFDHVAILRDGSTDHATNLACSNGRSCGECGRQQLAYFPNHLQSGHDHLKCVFRG